MSEKSFRTLLFVALLLLSPALLFLVQVVFIVPPVFLLAGIVYLLGKIFAGGLGSDNLTFLAFLAVHLLLFSVIDWLVAWLLSKLALLAPRGAARSILLGLLLAALAGVTQLPIYGGSGHGPAKLGPVQHLFASLDQSYGTKATLIVYLTAVGLVIAAWGWRVWRKRRHA